MNGDQRLFVTLIPFIIIMASTIYYLGSKNNTTRQGLWHPIWLTKLYDTPYKKKVLLYTSLVVRIVVPIILFSNLHPCNAMILNQILVDNIDPVYLINTSDPAYNRLNYQLWDKSLDWWSYLVSLLPMISNSNFTSFLGINNLTPVLLGGLLVMRGLGVVSIWNTGNYHNILKFPDYYSAIYYLISGTKMWGMVNKYIIGLLSIIAILSKTRQELYHHG